jgi:type I restriction enzyme R subunit
MQAMGRRPRMSQLAGALNFVLADEDRKARFLDQALRLLKAFALAGAREEALMIRDDVRFFADIRAAILKLASLGSPDASGRTGTEALDTAIEQLVSAAVAADEVIDVHAAAGMERPDLSILSDKFLEGLTKSDRPSLQAELLKKLINDKIRSLRKSNIVEARLFSDMLDEAIRRYQNRTLSTAEIIAELVELAKAMRDAADRGESLGLSDDELAFYDAIHENESAVLELGDDLLKPIARELVVAVQESATIDWNLKEHRPGGHASEGPTTAQQVRVSTGRSRAGSPTDH